MERYTAMYPRGQPGLPDDPVTAYVNNLCATDTAPGSTTTLTARTTRQHDPTRECNDCVASASSSSEPKPEPRHRGTDAQQQVRLDKLAEARHQLDEELALLRQELGVEAEHRDRQPVQDVPVQEQPREGNNDRRERRPAVDQPRGRATTPPAHRAARDNNRCANEGANVDVDADCGRRRRHDSDDDRDRSWSSNQRGPRAFGQSIRDAKFSSRFRAPTNVPRYDGDTNFSVWLEDYRLAYHAEGATDDLFVIKNLPLYLSDSARTWLEHFPWDKIHD
jgi:hypothetical protein